MTDAKYWKLPGGRYGGITARGKRFIVDSLGKARAKLGKKRSRSTRRSSNPVKRRVKRTARRKKRSSSKSLVRTAFKFVRLGALVAPAVGDVIRYSSNTDRAEKIISHYTGYSMEKQDWRFERLMTGWMPYLGACLATYGIPKITSILRRI